MTHYKDLQNELHVLEDEEFLYLLPEGSIAITDEEAEAIRVSKIIPLTYQELRARAYPPITNYIDGIVKGDTVQVQSYIDACLAVKALYPKV